MMSAGCFKVLQLLLSIDEELHLIKSVQDHLKRIREAWHVILEESKLVAGALGPHLGLNE